MPKCLPLPIPAGAQNLVLCLTTSLRHRDSEAGFEMKWKRSIRELCWKLGLNHETRRRALDHAIKVAKVWFAERGIKLNEVRRDGEIVFYLTELEAKAKIERKRLHLTEPHEEADDADEHVNDDDYDDYDSGYMYDEEGNRVFG